MPEIYSLEPRITPRVIVVDDDADVLGVLKYMLESHGNEVLAYSCGAEALESISHEAPDLVLLDVSMPEMSGLELCRRLKENPDLADIPVIFLSGLNATQDKVRGFQAGGVDYIAKPFQSEEVKARISIHLKLSALRHKLEFQKLVEKKVSEVLAAQQATIFTLAKLAELRDDDTGAHLERVRDYCHLLARWLGECSPYADHISADFIDCIQHASPLHDIGKVAIPDRILLKPGKLTPEEFEIMKSHTVIGAENMQTVFNRYADNPFIGMGIEIALYHHERWDGSGYPDGLVGKNIPLSARVMAVADCYDAIRSNRCYRKGLEHERVKAILLEESGSHFDPEIIRAFIDLEDSFNHINDTME
jgi:putative two-component system response regulator